MITYKVRNLGALLIVNNKIKSFEPENVAAQIPELNKMMAMRNLLRDLKSNLLDNSVLRKELERILQNKPELSELKLKLDEIAPLEEQKESIEEQHKTRENIR